MPGPSVNYQLNVKGSSKGTPSSQLLLSALPARTRTHILSSHTQDRISNFLHTMRCNEGRVEAHIRELVVLIGILVFAALQFATTIRIHAREEQSGRQVDWSFEAPRRLDYRNTREEPTPATSSEATTTTTTAWNFSSPSFSGRDWFEGREQWTKHPATNSCYVFDNLCHSTQQWFYDNNSSSRRHQPPFMLKLRWKPIQGIRRVNTLPLGYPSELKVLDSIPEGIQQQCLYSPIANHVVLYSFSNHMLGEFYVRVLIGLWDIVSAITGVPSSLQSVYQAGDSVHGIAKKLSLFLEQTQFYMHLEKGTESLLDSHSLFMNMFQSNPLLQFKTLLDNTGCRCLRRLILCGYHENPFDYQQSQSSQEGDSLILEPFQYVGHINHGSVSQGMGGADENDKQIMRQILRDWTIGKNSILQDWVKQHRESQITPYLPPSELEQEGAKSSSSEWKIVGLAQRTKRRRWLDVQDLQKMCNRRFRRQKIVCVIVNIEEEKWANPIKHVVAHGGLDVLIGIHGAQLTEALWMPPHSLVVELLPWIHPQVHVGKWTRWVHRPTPLGEIFTQTDLNHIGYPLSRDSAPYCKGIVTRDCFSLTDHHWDNRDFVIDDSLLIDIIEKFVVHRPVTCEDYERQAGDEYVLYNVNCMEEEDSFHNKQTVVKHLYRDRNWVLKKEPTNYTE